MDREAVGGGEGHRLGNHQTVARIVRACPCRQGFARPIGEAGHRDLWRRLGPRGDEGDAITRQTHGVIFEPFA